MVLCVVLCVTMWFMTRSVWKLSSVIWRIEDGEFGCNQEGSSKSGSVAKVRNNIELRLFSPFPLQ